METEAYELQPSAPAVLVNNLSYSVSGKEILKNICLKVLNKQFVGLIGPNGSGKTTLVRHVYRALPPSARTVMVHGRDITELSYRDSAREITVMRQENSSDFSYSILEMVLMGRSPYRKMFEMDSAEDKQLAHESLKRVGMDDMAHRKFANLSGGEKQRVLIARSLAQGADILLLDEPTNHLDVHYQWALMETIKSLGKTVLSVFHELNLACAYCDYLYILKDRQIVMEGTPVQVCTKEMLADVFRVDAEVFHDDDGTPRIIYKKALQK